jgi:mannose/fructose/N-acetylgalactosamine-specific phosphotransferase system component IIC
MKMIKRIAIAGLMLLMMFFAVSVFAQTNTNSVPPAGGTASVSMVAVWNALIVALVPLVIAAIKKWVLPNVPGVVWPVVAPLLGIASNWLAVKAGLLPQTGLALGALCGAAGVGLREVIDQVKQLKPSPSPAPLPPPPQGS